jgi:predicted kinase
MKLIVVNGAPATGKTTLSKKVAASTGLPLLSKDMIKEFLFDHIGVGDREWSHALGSITSKFLVAVIDKTLAAGRSIIVENTFDASFARSEFEQLITKYSPDFIELYCQADDEVRFKRFIKRDMTGSRHPGHIDPIFHDKVRKGEQIERQKHTSLGLGKTIYIDTTNFDTLDIDEILKQL